MTILIALNGLLPRNRIDPVRDTLLSHENFAVAPRFLPARLRRDLLALYGFARFVDDLGEDQDCGEQLLDVLSADLTRLDAGLGARLPVLRRLAPVLARGRVPIEPLERLVEANRVDLHVRSYATFEDLLGYCHLSADPIGEVVLHLVGRATTDRIELSNRICTGLQLVEHWQDVAEDHQAGRTYLPQVDLAQFGVTDDDLSAPSATPQLRALLAYETDRARAWMDAGAPLVSTLRGWPRLAVSGYLAGGRAAVQCLRRQGFDPMSGPVKPTNAQIAAMWLQATVRWPG